MKNFDFTPEDAQPIAIAVAKQLRRQRMNPQFEVAPFPGAPYRPTITASESGKKLLIEAQFTFDFHRELIDLATWMMTQRHYGELLIATTPAASITPGILNDLRELGVGVLLVAGDKVEEFQAARNPALIVNPDPTLKFGPCKTEVETILRKFNYVNRKDGLRDMCEVVERETEVLLKVAIKKNLITIPLTSVAQKDWSEQIDTLGSAAASQAGAAVVEDKLKTDLHSFRGARNLLGHKITKKRDELKRQRQFAERMAQGPRLLAELLSLRRKIS